MVWTFIVLVLLFMAFCGLLAAFSEWWSYTPSMKELEARGWGERGKDWEYDSNNRPRRINRWSDHHEG